MTINNARATIARPTLARRVLLAVLPVASALSAATAAQAAVTTYFGEDLQTTGFSTSFAHPNADAASAQFQSHLTGVTTQNFEGIAVGTSSPISVAFGTSTATITGTTAVVSGTPQSDAFATSGTHYVFATSDLVLTFNQPQAAFGFYGTDIGDSGATSLVLTLNNATQETVNVPANFTYAADGSVLFEGIIAPAGEEFTGVTFPNNSGGADYFGFDDFTIATTAQVNPPGLPEPASAGLIAVAAGAATLRRRRRTV